MRDQTQNFNIFLPFAKVDVAQRMVYGWASTPTKDLQNEIVTIDAIKGALPAYMEWCNIREMHQPSAVGVCKNAEIVDGGAEQTGLYIAAKIVDDAAWLKVTEGVYKGFSIGGEKLAKTGDTVTKLNLIEISIVDRPANPDCRIDCFKAVGLESAGGVVHGGDVVFDRREMGFMARIVAKLSGKSMNDPDSMANAGYTATNGSPAAPAVVDHGNPANVGATVPSSPLPALLTAPGGTPVPSSTAYLNDIPPNDHNRIQLMSGKYHVFQKDGHYLGTFDDGPAAAKALKEHLDSWDAQKMMRKAAQKARKVAGLERAPEDFAQMFKAERRVLAKRHIEKGHRKFLKTMIAVVEPEGKKAEKRLTRKYLARALVHLQGVEMLYSKSDLAAMEKAVLGALASRGLSKKEESTANVNDLPDSDFAFISPGGSKDSEGKTTPRSLRHLPIHDKVHVQNAAARLNQTDIPAEAKAKAHRKIKARGKEFGVEISDPGEKAAMSKAERKAAKKANGIDKSLASTIEELRSIQRDIVADGESEGGDPKDEAQADELDAVINHLEQHQAEAEGEDSWPNDGLFDGIGSRE